MILGAALLAMGVVVIAQADPPRYRLEYTVPEAARCPTREEWIQLFHAKAGYRAIAPDGSRRLRVQAQRDGEQLRVVVQTCEDQECYEREFNAGASECLSMMEAAALATTLELQLGGMPPPPQPPPPASEQGVPLPEPTPGALLLAVAGGVDATVSGYVSALAAVRVGRWSLGSELRLQPYRQHPLGSSLTLTGFGFAVTALPCYDTRPVMLCAELGAGAERLEVQPVMNPVPAWHPTFQGGARVGAFAGWTKHTEVGISVRGGLSLSRARLWVDTEVVHHAAPFYAGLEVWLRWNR